jgi:hypothetical protein
VERNDGVLSCVLPPREANIPDDANETPSGDKRVIDASPYQIELSQERLVVLDVPKLTFCAFVLLQRPVRRRGDGEMNRIGFEKLQVPGVTVIEAVRCRYASNSILYECDELRVFGNGREGCLGIAVLQRIEG